MLDTSRLPIEIVRYRIAKEGDWRLRYLKGMGRGYGYGTVHLYSGGCLLPGCDCPGERKTVQAHIEISWISFLYECLLLVDLNVLVLIRSILGNRRATTHM